MVKCLKCGLANRCCAPWNAREGCIPVGCRGGGCGVCKVRVVSGRFDFGAMSCRHVSADERGRGLALACRLFPGRFRGTGVRRGSPGGSRTTIGVIMKKV
ncbi:2Fe-2S iron-sulfur cluster-binding protein [Azotobacter chroococcum]